MTDRHRILALAAEYDKADKRNTRGQVPERDALVEAIRENGARYPYRMPKASNHHSATAAIRAWVAASRRAAANPTRRKGPAVPAGRTRRISARVSDATEAVLKVHAERTGRSAATVAGDMLETATQALRGEGGSDE